MPSIRRHVTFSLQEQYTVRRKFVLKVYVSVLVGICLTILQWIPIALTEKWRRKLMEHYFISYAAVAVGFCALVGYTNFPECREVYPYSVPITFVIFECFVFGFLPTFLLENLSVFGYSALIAFCLSMLCTVIGKSLEHDLTEDYVCMGISTTFFLLFTVIFVIVSLVLRDPVFDLTFAAISLTFVCLYTVYHSQIVFGGRSSEIDVKDYLMAALVVYFDFIILFLIIIWVSFYYGLRQPWSG